jgi:hypothetical protein
MKHTMNTNQTQMIFGAVLVANATGISSSMHCNSGCHAVQQCLDSSSNSKMIDSIDGSNAAPRIKR